MKTNFDSTAFEKAYAARDNDFQQTTTKLINKIYYFDELLANENAYADGGRSIAGIENHDSFDEELSTAIHAIRRAFVEFNASAKLLNGGIDVIPYLPNSDKRLTLNTTRDFMVFLVSRFDGIAKDISNFIERFDEYNL